MSLEDAIRRVDSGHEAVVVDLEEGVETALEEFNRLVPGLPAVVLTSRPTIAHAVRLAKLGAQEVVERACEECEVREVIDRVAKAWRDRRPAVPDEHWRHLLVGKSAAMEMVAETIRLVARRRSTVLITGETGTGKEMAARALHLASPRHAKPLVSINCSALPENLLEAELFGHVRGAFTGALHNRAGRFEAAHGGTIFLDEIGDMPLELQAKILRVIQDREFQRIGSSETTAVDVRVIAATNVDLEERVRDGAFRADLFYRLNVVPLRMPPLRERRGDVPVLAMHFADKVCRHEAIPPKRIAPETLDRLAQFDWPGNVRQLENAVEMAVALSADRTLLVPGDFPLPSRIQQRPLAEPVDSDVTLPPAGIDFEATIGAIELSLLEQALRRANGNKTQAADILRLNRTTLNAKLKSIEAKAQRAASGG
jgi:DNA-binding NtrC family response regulator